MTSTTTRQTAKGHGLKDGDEFTFYGRSKAPFQEGIRARLVRRSDGSWCTVETPDGKYLDSFGSASKFHASDERT